ncbi:MAE_28990/MAE_18760 family HEPN-like nuclease [Mesorhizobium sp. ISC15]|uniref:MAE_28990/MAE_18760 family HEPN-like nuclease n=1 Tax=Mesorhizobium sp. ISC15 TaxID=3076429 RepID=UPI00301D031A
MTAIRTSIDERREEFDTHYAVAVALEDRIFAGADVSIGETKLSSRHLLTMKSGLIVHLYNIVEATMFRATELVGSAVGTVPPRRWSENALREWLREYAVARVDGGEDSRLTTVHNISLRLLGDAALGPQQLKKPSGTWTDKHIAIFAERLGVEFRLSEAMWRRIAPRPEFRDKSPLEFLADRRNALAHGRRSFEEGANDLTLTQIREIADVTLDYVDEAAAAFQSYVDRSHYLVLVS